MAIKFLSGLNLSNVTAGSILKLDSNGNIVAATAGTDYLASSLWTTSGSNIYYSSGNVTIGTSSNSAPLHVYGYQTTDPKLLIEDGNTGDASMQFKISTQSYTMGIDNSDGDKFKFSSSTAFGTNNIFTINTSSVTFLSPVYNSNVIHTRGNDYGILNTYGSLGNSYSPQEGGTSAVRYWVMFDSTNNASYPFLTNRTPSGAVVIKTGTAAGGGENEHFRIEGGDGTVDAYFTNANVGISTTSPTSALDVSGIITTRNSSLLRRYVSTWTNADTHDVLYNGWTSTMGDYVYLKAQGNSTGGHGMILVGDNVAYIGRSDVETGSVTGLDQTWATFKNGGVGIGTTSPSTNFSVRATTATHQLVGINRANSDTAALYLGNNSSNDAIISGNNAPISLGKDVSGTYTEYVNIATDGELKFSAYGAGILKTNASGIVSVDTSTYVTDVDWSDINSINGTININSTTQIGQGDTETLVSFQNSGTERGSFQVDDSANSYFVATGFKTATASTGFLKANGTVDTSTYLTSVAFSDITSKPTTLSGYGITDGATVDYVDTELSGLASESWANTNLVNVTGDTMTGDLTIKRGHGDLTFLTLKQENTSGDLVAQKSFIDFTFVDSNTNETPQVRIGAEVGNNDGSASSLGEEGMGAFVVYTNNADTDAGAAGTSLAERLRVDRLGRVGIGSSNPAHPLHVVGDIYTTSDFRGNSIISTNAALSIDNTGIQPAQGEVEDIVAFKFSTTKVAHVDTDGYISATGFKTNTASTGFLKANGTVDTSTYLTSYTETDTLDSVTDRGATTTNNISIGNLTAVGGTFTDPVTIYDSTTTENPRLSVGRNSGESIQFNVTDNVNTITAKQDSDSNGVHTFVLDRVFAGTGDSVFSIHNDGTPDLTINGSGVVSFNQYNTAGILQVNTSGTISVDTSSYLTSYTETSTLDNVADRGATTNQALTLGSSATSGGRILSANYTGSNRLGVISSEYSSGDLLLGYGVEGKNGSAGFVSTYGNFSGAHSVLQVASSSLDWRVDASNSQTEIGSDLTLASQFSVSRTGVLTMGDGFTSTKGNTAYTDRNKWDGGSTGLNAATGRTSLGLGTAATSAATDFVAVGGDTVTGQITFPTAIANRPVFGEGIIARSDQSDTSGTHDIWGISERYYPSNSTAADAWGIQWSGTPNEINFIGAGQKKLSIDLDTAGTVKIDGNAVATESYVTTQISNLVDSAPAALDTLNELAAALGDDASFSTTMSTALGNRLRIDVSDQNLTAAQKSNASTNLGLGTASTSAATDFVAVTGDSMSGVLSVNYNGIGLEVGNSANSGADTGIRIRGARNGQSYSTNNLTSYILLSNYDDNTTPNNYDLVKIGGGMYDANADTGFLRIETNNGTALTKALDIDKNQDAKFYGDVDADGNITASNLNVSNWDTAYGWGDHSLGGYAASSHTHSAADITSGTLSASRLPTPVSGDWWNGGAAVVGTDGVMEIGKYIDWHDSDTETDDFSYRMTANSGRMYFSGDIEVDGGDIYITDGNTRLHEGNGNALKVTTDSGYIEMAPMNTSHCHIQTDRSNFYFNTEIRVDSGIIGSYNEDLLLRRAGTTKITCAASTTTIEDNTVINGTLEATAKSFNIEHPTKEGKRLVYGSLEGAEHGVYFRGKGTGEVIELPEHWTGLVHEDSITVQLTPIGKNCVWVEDIKDNAIHVGMDNDTPYFYFIQGERKDIDKLIVEQDA